MNDIEFFLLTRHVALEELYQRFSATFHLKYDVVPLILQRYQLLASQSIGCVRLLVSLQLESNLMLVILAQFWQNYAFQIFRHVDGRQNKHLLLEVLLSVLNVALGTQQELFLRILAEQLIVVVDEVYKAMMYHEDALTNLFISVKFGVVRVEKIVSAFDYFLAVECERCFLYVGGQWIAAINNSLSLFFCEVYDEFEGPVVHMLNVGQANLIVVFRVLLLRLELLESLELFGNVISKVLLRVIHRLVLIEIAGLINLNLCEGIDESV